MMSARRLTQSLLRKRPNPSHSPLISLSPHRFRLNSPVSFSTSNEPPPKNKPPSTSSLLQHEQVDATSRGLGQVIFLNSPQSGNVILFSLALADPTLAAFSALGALTSTSTSKLLGLDPSAWKDGLWGYNGALVGCAASVFASGLGPALAGTLAGAIATPVVSASLRNVTDVPQWTWSFNFVTLSGLMQTRPLLGSSDDGAVVENTASFMDVVTSPLVGVSQIFVVNSHLTGAGIVAAIGMYSPGLALHALGGSATGCFVGMILGADLSDLAIGLYGYNAALTSMAVGAFFVDSTRTRLLSCAGAAASTVLFGAMKAGFGAYGVPCLTLPFCTVATACYLLDGQIPGLSLANSPHSPERNTL